MRQLLFLFALALAISSIYGEETEADPSTWESHDESSTEARDQLLTTLFATYKNYNYPSNNSVRFGLNILTVAFDQEQDLMNTNVWLRYVWQDNRLTWDKDTVGVSVLRIPAEKVWLPDITLYNGVYPKMECSQTQVLVYSTGKVLWVPPCRLQSYCNLTLTQFPYQEQVCTLKFGSWTMDGRTQGLEHFDEKKHHIDVEEYHDRKYSITKNEAVKEEKKYACCAEPYLDILFTLGFTRHGGGVKCNN